MKWIQGLQGQGTRDLGRLLWSAIDRRSAIEISVCVLLGLITAAITAATPVTLMYLIDGFKQQSSGTSAILWAGLWVAGLCVGRILGSVRTYVALVVQQRTSMSISEKVFAHVLRLPLRFHMERRTGAVSEALNKGAQAIQVVYEQLFTTLLPLALQLAAMTVVLSEMQHAVFIYYFLGALALYTISFSWNTRRQFDSVRDFGTRHIDAHAALTDGVMNYEPIKYFSAEGIVCARYKEALKQCASSWIAFCRSRVTNDLAMSAIFAAFLAVTVLHAAYQVQQGSMTVGQFILVQTYAIQVVAPIESVGMSIQAVFNAFADIERLSRILGLTPEPLQEGRVSFGERPPQLEFRNVSFSYRQDLAALHGVSFVVPAGKTVGIVGASGAGKSSLVKLLVRFFEPDSGQILLDEVPISDLPLLKLRRAISVVPQDTALFNETIAFNVGIGSPESSPQDIEEATVLARLRDFVSALPLGLQTNVGERGVKLSGGERQRIALARAAIRRPLIYVFDEATSSLDSRTETEIMNNLRELARRSTCLIIAHRLSTVVHADEIVVLEHGAIVERGTHAELLQLNGKYRSLWAAQHREVSAPAA